MRGNIPVSVIIHTLNEELNIANALENVLNWANQVIVVDSDSTDNTQSIAKKYDVDIISRPCSRAGLVDQRNWALDTINFKNKWVFILDADEIIDNFLKKEVEQIVYENNLLIHGYSARSKMIFMGKWVKRNSHYPTWVMRLFQHKLLRYEKREANAGMILDSKKHGYLKGHTENNDSKGFDAYLDRMKDFSTLEAKALINSKRNKEAVNSQITPNFFGSPNERRRFLKNIFVSLPFKPLIVFIYLYFFRLGFLEGRVGFHYAFYKSVLEWSIIIKTNELDV